MPARIRRQEAINSQLQRLWNPRRKLTRSRSLLRRAKLRVVNQTQTLSKGTTQFVQGVSPVFLERGRGSHVWDVDGNEYIDYVMGLGAVILGYAYGPVDRAIERQLRSGISFTLPTRLETDLVERIASLVPSGEMARFAKNGSDVTNAAVRIARAYTGREKIVSCGYHGSADWFMVKTSRNKGVPPALADYVMEFEYNNTDSLKALFEEHPDQIAAVIMEPVGVQEPKARFLDEVRSITRRNDALLIFDEIITGFRFSLGGAQKYFGVIPDLTCLGKGMSNGMPLSALVGKREIMESTNEVFLSMTFGGEALSLAAAIATIDELEDKRALDYIWRLGSKFKDAAASSIAEADLETTVSCRGYPPRTIFDFKDDSGKQSLSLKSLFLQETIKKGLIMNGQDLSYSHSPEEITYTTDALREVMSTIRMARDSGTVLELLEGPQVEPVFRRP